MLPDLHAAYADTRRRSRLAILHLSAKRAFVGLLLLGAMQAMIGYAQALVGLKLPSFQLGEFWDPEQRIFGTLGHPVLFAAFIIVVLLACIFVLTKGPLHRHHAALLTGYTLAIMPALVLTHERVMWVVFLMLAFGVFFYANRSRA